VTAKDESFKQTEEESKVADTTHISETQSEAELILEL
jgi:hypothetical protein